MSASEPRRGAFFDLDKTLIPGSSLFLLARGAYDRDMFRVRDILRFGWGQLAFQLRGERRKGMQMARTSTLEFVQGRSQADLVAWGREIVEERILPRVYTDIVRVIESHRQQGDLTFLVTAAPIELAQTIAEALGMTGAIATVSEVDDHGAYTGRIEGNVMHGPEKARAVQRVAEDRAISLRDSAAYSDSMNDLPLLEAVGHAHTVNPEWELRRIALARGWPIHDLRPRRRTLLIGIPAGIGGVGLFGSGVAAGVALERRRRRREGSLRRRLARIPGRLPPLPRFRRA